MSRGPVREGRRCRRTRRGARLGRAHRDHGALHRHGDVLVTALASSRGLAPAGSVSSSSFSTMSHATLHPACRGGDRRPPRETRSARAGQARGVLREDPRDDLPDAALRVGAAERLQSDPAGSGATGLAGNIHGVPRNSGLRYMRLSSPYSLSRRLIPPRPAGAPSTRKTKKATRSLINRSTLNPWRLSGGWNDSR